jgi:hypothetical protein
LCNSILDWKDNNRDARIQGAKTDYYQGLNPPYVCKNGPIDDISELLLIKGITPELYWGTAGAGDGEPVLNRFGQPVTYPFGLVDVFTPFSRGSINWHTASDHVRQALGIDPVISQNFENFLSAVPEDGPAPPMNLQSALSSAGVPGPMVQILAARFGDQQGRGYTFQVTVDAAIGANHRYFNAIIGQNGPRDVQILSFYWTTTKPKAPAPAGGLPALP